MLLKNHICDEMIRYENRRKEAFNLNCLLHSLETSQQAIN